MREDDARGAEGAGDDAGLDDAVADGAGGLVAAAAHDGRACLEAGGFGAAAGDAAADFGGFVERGQDGAVEPEASIIS